MIIQIYEPWMQDSLNAFYTKVFKENKRSFNLQGKEKDIGNIEQYYLSNGCFWCAVDAHSQIIGAIGLRKIEDFYEIRRFFVYRKHQNKGVGTQLLNTLLSYVISTNVRCVKIATMFEGHIIRDMLIKKGFEFVPRYNESTADLFLSLTLTDAYVYKHQLETLQENYKHSLILNPTENIPYHPDNTCFFEGLYVSERFKDVNDKVIFAGRDDYIL